ncbi:MAG TPA: hypothetical protein VK623_10415 [Flavobacterium sp.]|nr:hypothetical protein [Flavobacterium sp.]
MQKFHLEILFHLIGIGSASGLFYDNGSIFIISDNGGYLYEYKTQTAAFEKTAIIENGTENIPKKLKPDFEALAVHGDKLYVFGSGSTENRNKMVTIDRHSKAVISTTDLAFLYSAMQGFGQIKPEDFNIEGVVYTGEKWYFFQRGNGKKGGNGIFTVSGNNLGDDFSILYNEVKLPKIDGVRATFTDAVLVGNDIYFLAAAEDSNSVYEDGEVLGSVIGKMDIETMKVAFIEKITGKQKFEGIALFQQSDKDITFLLCEDNDTESLESDIYKLVLTK